jgi:23S rRNA (cytidine1920-2'-O)/16S rRNA (cytidine1409-2'-O)-methyltransferase
MSRRLDEALVERGLANTRSRARALVMAGQVRVDGQVAAKPAMRVTRDAPIAVDAPPPFVSRGGDKLDAALGTAGIDPGGRTCLDIGASTGGFTDCLLQRGAAAVIAVDVGYGQLDYGLRQDPRVHVLERVNARYLSAEQLPAALPRPDLLVMDVAFISVTKVLPAAGAVCAPACDALVLVKPQFECGPQQVGAGGVVASATVRRATLTAVATAAVAEGWTVAAAIPSPIRGQAGNWECFLQLRRPAPAAGFASLGATLRAVEVPEG